MIYLIFIVRNWRGIKNWYIAFAFDISKKCSLSYTTFLLFQYLQWSFLNSALTDILCSDFLCYNLVAPNRNYLYQHCFNCLLIFCERNCKGNAFFWLSKFFQKKIFLFFFCLLKCFVFEAPCHIDCAQPCCEVCLFLKRTAKVMLFIELPKLFEK